MDAPVERREILLREQTALEPRRIVAPHALDAAPRCIQAGQRSIEREIASF